MDKFKDIEEMVCEEIEKIGERGELSGTSLDMLDKLSHTLKSLKTIEAMSDYSEDGYGYESMSYARGRNRRRDSMGRYSSESRYAENRYPERRY